MSYFSRKSRRWIAFSLWAAGTLVIIMLGVWNFLASRKDAEHRLSAEAGHIAAQLAGLVSIPDVEIDYMAANAIMTAAMENEQLYAIKIETSNGYIDGQRRNYLWEPIAWDNEIAENCIQGMNLIKEDGKITGKVEVWLSPRMNDEEEALLLKREIFRISLTAMIWSAGFIFLLWYVGDFRRFYKYICHTENSENKNDSNKKILNVLEDGTKSNMLPNSRDTEHSRGIVINADLGRQYQKKEKDAWLVTSGMFRQTFSNAPALINKLFSRGEVAGLSHLGRILEQAAPCIGAKKLEEAARAMQTALNNPEKDAAAIQVEECYNALIQVLGALDKSASSQSTVNKRR